LSDSAPKTRAITAASSTVQQTTTVQEMATRTQRCHATPAVHQGMMSSLPSRTDDGHAHGHGSPSTNLRQQVLSLQQTIEGLASIVQ
ncbi:hypothetical protein LSAT2_025669, partial [Lamellibrachia satsuma]